MKKTFTVICLLLMPWMGLNLMAQEFSFQMFFEDFVGNKDTLTMGFDNAGTSGIDPMFGEINIIDEPLKRTLDVRITDEWDNRFIHSIPGTFHTKKQIVKKQECGVKFSINSIDIFTHHWPVTVTWDSSLFTDPCLEASLFTSFMPYGWWDTGGFIYLLPLKSSLTFEPNEIDFSEYYGYINSNMDTLNVFWQTFGDSSLITSSVNMDSPQNLVKVFPNPAKTVLYFETESPNLIKTGTIYSISGKLIQNFESLGSVDISGLARGVYVLRLIDNENNYFSKLFVVDR